VPGRHPLLLMLALTAGCLDTHDASLGEQETGDEVESAPDGSTGDAGQPAPDAGRDAEPDADDGEEEEDDAGTSLLCRLEPWHCT
jgi:hypothetical protein